MILLLRSASGAALLLGLIGGAYAMLSSGNVGPGPQHPDGSGVEITASVPRPDWQVELSRLETAVKRTLASVPPAIDQAE